MRSFYCCCPLLLPGLLGKSYFYAGEFLHDSLWPTTRNPNCLQWYSNSFQPFRMEFSYFSITFSAPPIFCPLPSMQGCILFLEPAVYYNVMLSFTLLSLLGLAFPLSLPIEILLEVSPIASIGFSCPPPWSYTILCLHCQLRVLVYPSHIRDVPSGCLSQEAVCSILGRAAHHSYFIHYLLCIFL